MVFDGRNGIYWGIIIAVAGLILVGADAPPKQNRSASQANGQGAVTQSERPLVTRKVEKLTPTRQDSGCKRGKDDRQSDLCAQWKAADAAYDAAQWSFWQMAAGAIGVIIGGTTLIFAWRAAHWAKQAAGETKRSADFARDSYVAFTDLERARVVAETSRVLFNPHSIAAVEISLTNIGKSSAALLVVRCDFMNGCAFPEKFQREMRIDRALESQNASTFLMHSFDDDATFKTHPFVGGYIEYRSSFGKTLRAHFLGRIDSTEIKDEEWIGTDHQVRSDALYCSREEREGRFGWPADD